MGNKTRIAVIEEYDPFHFETEVNKYLAGMEERLINIDYLPSFREYENGEKDEALIAIIRYIDE